MDPKIVLAQLKALVERSPDFARYTPASRDHAVWLGQAHALLSKLDTMDALEFKMAADWLHSSLMKDSSVGKIYATLHRAIAALELEYPDAAAGAYAGGQVYDFFNALNRVISSAEKSLFVVDPYLDQTVFDHYLSSRKSIVKVRILVGRDAEKLSPAIAKYRQQYGDVLEARASNQIHDRVIFVDSYVCWLIGQSLKDAAKAKPTYLVQAPPDVVPTKLASYEEIWASANSL